MWGDLCWLENDNFTTKITNNGAKSCTNRFGCQIGFHTMAVVQGLIGIHENHSGQNDSYNGSDCARIVQIFLAPKWHHYLLQNLYQPGPNSCRRHYVTRYCSTSHINPPPPPPPPPKLCPPVRPPTTTTSHSTLRATCPCLILRHWPGTSRTGCLAVSARQRWRRDTSVSFSRRACSSSKKHGSFSRGTPSSQRVAARSTCFGHFIL